MHRATRRTSSRRVCHWIAVPATSWFAMLHPERLLRLTVASAGWYTLPDDQPYPLGLGPQPNGNDTLAAAMRARLGAFLQLPLDISVGTRDDRRDRNTRRGQRIDHQQGRHRLERAHRWCRALAGACADRGIPSRIRLTLLPGVGHDFHRCIMRAGLDQLVVGPRPGDERAVSAWPRLGIRHTLADCPASGSTLPAAGAASSKTARDSPSPAAEARSR